MAKRVLTATHEGQTFTRKTERTYAFVVVAKPNIDDDRLINEERARYTATHNHAYHVAKANDATHVYSSEEDRANTQHIAGLTRLQFYSEILARGDATIKKNLAAGYYDRYVAQGWCGRRDLAEKLAVEVHAQKHRKAITIVPVNQ